MESIKFHLITVVLFTMLKIANSQTIDVVSSQNKFFFMYNISYKFESHVKDFEILDTILGKDLVGLKYEAPFSELEVKKNAQHEVVVLDNLSNSSPPVQSSVTR